MCKIWRERKENEPALLFTNSILKSFKFSPRVSSQSELSRDTVGFIRVAARGRRKAGPAPRSLRLGPGPRAALLPCCPAGPVSSRAACPALAGPCPPACSRAKWMEKRTKQQERHQFMSACTSRRKRDRGTRDVVRWSQIWRRHMTTWVELSMCYHD